MILANFDYGLKRSIVLTVTGHADFAPTGQDLICAGATTLCYALAQTIMDAYSAGKLAKKPKLSLTKGDIKIECVPKKAYYHELLHAFYCFQTGFEVLEDNYKANVKVVKKLT